MSFPPFHPDHEAARLAEARNDPGAVSVAKCTGPGCPVTGTADKPISSALLIHRMESHAAASGHVVAIEVRPDPEHGDG